MPKTYDHTIASDGVEIPAILCVPDNKVGPGIVLIQEIFGVNDYILSVAERLANIGYVVVAPHMYWRQQHPYRIDARGAEDLEPAIAMADQHNNDDGMADIGAAIDHLVSDPNVSDGVGVMGFCFGGSMTYLAAAAHNPTCAVSYYGYMVGDNLDKAASITCPILFHFGDDDPYLPNEHVAGLRAVTKDMDNVEILVQEGAGHAFDNDKNPMFVNPSAATASWARTREFLATHLPTSH